MTDLECRYFFFLLALPLVIAFLLNLAEDIAISDVGVYLGNENKDKTTGHGGQSMAAMSSLPYPSQTFTLQSLYILNSFKAEGPQQLSCVLLSLPSPALSPALNWCLYRCSWAFLELGPALNNHRIGVHTTAAFGTSEWHLTSKSLGSFCIPGEKGRLLPRRICSRTTTAPGPTKSGAWLTPCLVPQELVCSSFFTRFPWGLVSSLLPFWRTLQSYSLSFNDSLPNHLCQA